jgi:hypothetical protein
MTARGVQAPVKVPFGSSIASFWLGGKVSVRCHPADFALTLSPMLHPLPADQPQAETGEDAQGGRHRVNLPAVDHFSFLGGSAELAVIQES